MPSPPRNPPEPGSTGDANAALRDAALPRGAVVCAGYRVEKLRGADRSGHTYEVVEPRTGARGLGYVLWLRLRERALERWTYETTQVNRVDVAGIPRTLAAGAGDGGRAVVVTEHASGDTLDELRRAWGGRLPGPTAIDFAAEMLDTLEAAHGQGVVHGALRAEGILVDPESAKQRIFFADIAFGRLLIESYRRMPAASASPLLGTLAPEQLSSEVIADARTDVYGIGALTLALLGGDLGELSAIDPSDEASRRAWVADRVRDGLPSTLVDVLLRGIAPARSDRFPAAWVFADELRHALGGGVERRSPADEESRSIVTVDKLVEAMIHEARVSMGEPTGAPVGPAPVAAPHAVPVAERPVGIMDVAGVTEEDTGVVLPPSGFSFGGPPSARTAPAAPAPPPAPASSRVLPAPPSASAFERPIGITELDGVVENETGVVLPPSGVSLSRIQASLGAARPKLDPDATAEAPKLDANATAKVAPILDPDETLGAPAVSSDDAGSFGRYTIDRPIASGGMATVYLGTMAGAAGFTRTVAIKKLHASLAADPKFSRMMLDEAKMASRISHPNVVPILDVVSAQGTVMLVFEYVLGVTLGQLVRAEKGRLAVPLPVAAAIVVGALRGLEAAHTATNELGEPLHLVHRDISPQNIMIAADGTVRVIDFGIARALGRAEVTTGNELRGKASYMAPERFRGQKSDHRIDLWSVGVVLWELVCGRKLFDSDDPIEAALMVCTGAVPQTGIDAVDRILERALARDVSARFASADEMARAIQSGLLVADQGAVAALVRERCGAHIDTHREALRALLGTNAPSRADTSGLELAVATTRAADAVAPLVPSAASAKAEAPAPSLPEVAQALAAERARRAAPGPAQAPAAVQMAAPAPSPLDVSTSSRQDVAMRVIMGVLVVLLLAVLAGWAWFFATSG
ncbi:MAG: serine/threonine-protein kinase [Polyangiaceae bacterium]